LIIINILLFSPSNELIQVKLFKFKWWRSGRRGPLCGDFKMLFNYSLSPQMNFRNSCNRKILNNLIKFPAFHQISVWILMIFLMMRNSSNSKSRWLSKHNSRRKSTKKSCFKLIQLLIKGLKLSRLNFILNLMLKLRNLLNSKRHSIPSKYIYLSSIKTSKKKGSRNRKYVPK